MAVRRLAEKQPDSFAFTPENEVWAKETIARYPPGREASAVIPILWRAQEQEGWLTKPAIETVAQMLAMPLIRVLEVATFYTMFHLQPVGRKAHILVCGTTPCMLCGAGELIEVCKRRITPHPFELSADGDFSWEEVECLGAFVNAPMVQIGKDTYEDLTAESFEAIVETIAAGRRPKPGPQIDRMTSAPKTGLTSLTEVPGGGDEKRRAPRRAARAEPREREGALAKGAPRTAVQDSAGGESLEGEQARRRAEAEEAAGEVASPPPAARRAKQERAGRPTATGRSEDEAAATEPTNDEAGVRPTARKPREPATVERVRGAVEHRGHTGAVEEEVEQRADKAGIRPVGLEAPREGRRDDLKIIEGIGRATESRLNDLGIWHLDQIAGWTEAEAAWIGAYLGMTARMERDDWVGQAKRLVEAIRADRQSEHK
jgi:NADH-quinone oxidoreductase subunit E